MTELCTGTFAIACLRDEVKVVKAGTQAAQMSPADTMLALTILPTHGCRS